MIVVLASLAVALALWSWWLIHRTRASRWFYAPTAIAALAVVGMAGLTLVRLGQTLDRLDERNPAERQAALAQGISSAMMWTVAAFAVAGVWAVVLGIGTVRVKRRGQPA